ncbi:MAG: 4Fe-4S dicluster domain-containing protein [Desulfocapsaceae bacterium]|nr:4Fe-4S dicluster domain-containing protein [Desulfocapsaceae bacterium]
MAHHLQRSGYSKLVDRLNRFPQGAPPSPLLNRILKILFTEKEADLVSLLPLKPFTADKAAQIWQLPLSETEKILDQLASRALLVDIVQNECTEYVLPPPMAGFFEFSMMRIRNDIDQKTLSELFYQYLNEEDDFIRDLFTEGETQLGRVFVHEPVIPEDQVIHVLDYEKASEVINTASHRGISLCYCRHKMDHLNRACSAPQDICMTFNTSAASLIRHGHAREVDRIECLELLHQAYENNLVQFGENIRKNVNFICNCCGCCCEAMLAAQRFSHLSPVHTTNFLPEVSDTCNGCGKCVSACPVEAMVLVSANNPHKPKLKRAKLYEELCLGCGVCVRQCRNDALELQPRGQRVITPLDSVHRTVVMAIERGKLSDLLFDNRVLFSHRALAGVFKVILALPPVKQIMANRQIKSTYLEKLLHKAGY